VIWGDEACWVQLMISAGDLPTFVLSRGITVVLENFQINE